MDLKTHILRWERDIRENPAVLALAIIVILTVAFLSAMFIDGFLKNRQNHKRKRGQD
jgi:hypothetical protein